MPKNNRVAKDLAKFNLRLTQNSIKYIRFLSETKDIPMNTIIQQIIDSHMDREHPNLMFPSKIE